jgi:hypothetical protein
MNTLHKRWTAFGGAVCAALLATQAQASLVLVDLAEISDASLNAAHTVLTVQAHSHASFEAGAVGVDADNQVQISGDAKTGGWQTQLLRLGDLGIGSAADLRVVFDAHEPGAAAKSGLSLTDLVLNVYSASGTLLFSSSLASPLDFPMTTPGARRPDAVFGLDAADSALAQASIFSGNFADYRIGLSARADDASGRGERFFITAAGTIVAVPEPQTRVLLLAGLCAVVFTARRRFMGTGRSAA